MTPRLITGRIVWAEVADANGIRKVRPAIIVTPTESLTATEPFDVVAVTSRLDDPLPDDHVLLPWHPRGHPRTGLNRRCAAVCTWLAQIVADDVQDVAGLVPTPIMGTILAKIAAASSLPSAATLPAVDAGPSASPPPVAKGGEAENTPEDKR